MPAYKPHQNDLLKPAKNVMDSVIAFYGGVMGAAAEFNVSHPTIIKWQKKLPVDRAIEIEEKSQGRFTREELLPRVFKKDVAKLQYKGHH